MAQLLRRIEIEGFPGFSEDILHEKPFFLLHFFFDSLPFFLVCGNACFLHGCQYRHQRLLHLSEQGQHPVFFQLLLCIFIEGSQEKGNAAALLLHIIQIIRINHRLFKKAGHIGQGIGHPGGIQKVRCQGHIKERKVFRREIRLKKGFAVLHHHSLCLFQCLGSRAEMVRLHQPGMAVSGSHHLFRLEERRLAGQMGPESSGLSFKGNSGIPDFHRRKDFFTLFLLHLGQFLKTGKCSELLQKIDSQFPKSSFISATWTGCFISSSEASIGTSRLMVASL